MRNSIVVLIKKGGLSILLISLLLYTLIWKDVNIGFRLSSPSMMTSRLIEGFDESTDEKGVAPIENKEPSHLSSLFPKSRGSFQNGLGEISDKQKRKYIHRFSKVAVQEMKKYGIPASIVLANALLHSQAGESYISRKAGNNHFGIPCTVGWKGTSSEFRGRCFRHYDNAWMSFRDHSIYMTSERFPLHQSLSAQDYRGWAKALEVSAYSPYPKLSRKLLEIIRDYDLTLLDQRS